MTRRGAAAVGLSLILLVVGMLVFGDFGPRSPDDRENDRTGPEETSRAGDDSAGAGPTSSDEPRRSVETGELRGAVRYEDGYPVVDADVRIDPWDDARNEPIRERALTGRVEADGTFTFVGVEPGRYLVDVSPDRSDDGYAVGVIVAGETVSVEVTIERGVTVRGVVTSSATGRPIPGARVKQYDAPALEVVADDKGRYALPGVGRRGMSLQFLARLETDREAPEVLLVLAPGESR
jgi:hypothetical protein